ncbi:MAG: FtsQ-type POTRA domain-containing protein [Deltaproteobacteria bacterium]|nr:FtsQ-type POTRA domain-containing protein [Deltaproteobacteria bacterium]
MKHPDPKRRRSGRSVLRDTRFDWAGFFAWRPARPGWTRPDAWTIRRPRWARRHAWRLPRPTLWSFGRLSQLDPAAWLAGLRARIDPFRRTRAARRLVWTGAGVVALAAVGAVGLYGPRLAAAIADHPYFAVSEIVVTPTTHVRPGALLESADLRPGLSLWRLDPDALAARLEAHPWIRRAMVRREFPRRLVVDVVERKPVAILYLDQLYYVDTTGLAFVRVGDRDPLDLPFVTGVEAAIVADERPFARHAIRQALRVLDLMQAAGLPFRVSEVHIEREQGVTVFPVEPRVALTFGWSGFKTKLARLERVLRDFRGRESRIREIDLTMGAAAVVRLRQPGAKGKRTRT